MENNEQTETVVETEQTQQTEQTTETTETVNTSEGNSVDAGQEKNVNTEQTEEKDDDYWVEKLSELMPKKRRSLMKSVLSSNNIDEDRQQAIFDKFAASEKTKADKATADFEALKTENSSLKQKLLNIEINDAATNIANEIGMRTDRLPIAMKIVDGNSIVKDGALDNAALKEALTKVLDDIPEFKGQMKTSTTLVRRVGADNEEVATKDPMARSREILGLTKKKNN